MATIIAQTGAEALEIIVGGSAPDRLEPNAHRVIDLPEGAEEIVVRRVALTEIEAALLASQEPEPIA